MALDLRQQLAAQFPQLEHQLAFFARGSRHLPYNEADVAGTLIRFSAEILPISPLVDPRGKQVSIVKGNFPKLVDLEHKTLKKQDFPAFQVLECIENGTFDPAHYVIPDSSRMKTLFWLPEVIQDPDAIYKNGHKIIAGHEVYVRVYDKMGSKVKLFFTMDISNKGKYVRTVPVTSFLTDPEMVINFVSGQPLYQRPKQK
ncbi:MAG: hypothetical protein ABSG96_03665 [Terracidiphilus sp.]|jgi:hypothetical protein